MDRMLPAEHGRQLALDRGLGRRAVAAERPGDAVGEKRIERADAKRHRNRGTRTRLAEEDVQ